MIRMIVGCILIGVFTTIILFNIGSMPWYGIGFALLVWDGLWGWMVYSGYKANQKKNSSKSD